MAVSGDRITLFLPSLRGGGAERVMVTLAQGFTERGLKVDLVLAKAEGPYISEVPAGVRVVDLGASRVLLALPGLMRYLRREKPTAMLSTLSHANIVAVWAKRLTGVPTRVVVREAITASLSSANAWSLRERLMPFLTRRFYTWADAVVAVSKGVAADLIQNVGLPANKVQVIYNPVVTSALFAKAEEPLVHPWFTTGEPPIILGVGRLTKQKDFATLIRAFALVRKEKPVYLMILGEGEERPKLENLVRELGLEEAVSLPGFLENPYKYMKRAAVFVLSSRWEGLPNVLIQALALGTPVVSTNCPSGPMEILEDGKWGELSPVGDIVSLARAIVDQISSSVPNDRLESVHDRFGLDNIINQYLNILIF